MDVEAMQFGIRGTTAAVVEAVVTSVLYFLLGVAAVAVAIRSKRPQSIVIVIFALARGSAFAIRANLEKHFSIGKLEAFEILFIVGLLFIIALLFHLYGTCILGPAYEFGGRLGQTFSSTVAAVVQNTSLGARLAKSQSDQPSLRNCGVPKASLLESAAHMACLIATVLGAIGATKLFSSTATASDISTGMDERKIFAAVVIILDILVLDLVIRTRVAALKGPLANKKLSLGRVLLLMLASALVTVKVVAQLVAIFAHPSLLFNPKYLYLLLVLPELLVLIVLVSPGFLSGLLDIRDLNRQNDTYSDQAAMAYATSTAPPSQV